MTAFFRALAFQDSTDTALSIYCMLVCVPDVEKGWERCENYAWPHWAGSRRCVWVCTGPRCHCQVCFLWNRHPRLSHYVRPSPGSSGTAPPLQHTVVVFLTEGSIMLKFRKQMFAWQTERHKEQTLEELNEGKRVVKTKQSGFSSPSLSNVRWVVKTFLISGLWKRNTT